MATLVVLAVGSLASAHCGIAVADDPGAAATGGSNTVGDLFQQNTAQESKQNNNCSQEIGLPLTTGELTDSRSDVRCVTDDASFNKHDLVEDGGARAEGGSSASSVFQQNTAQEGRLNNNCANPNGSNTNVSGGRRESGCVNKDASRNKHTTVKGGGAHAEGGSSTGSIVVEQNTAQEGRQNNNCANPNTSNVTATDGGRQKNGCVNKDASRNKHTVVKSGGARAEGGSATGDVAQQNTAQEGRQNNNCANATNSGVTASGGGRQKNGCVNKDASRNKHTVVKSGGAHAEGGSSTGGNVFQQNTAQEGRQNNNCANANASNVTASGGGRQKNGCVNKDASRNKHTVVKSGGAHAEGGSTSGGTLIQQNTAQEGRQNNNCANPNISNVTATDGGRQKNGCVNKDASRNKHTVVKSGGAHAEGGSTSGGSVSQQNTAQEGRQNNNCANPNDSGIELTDSDAELRCLTVDESTNVGTVEIGDGAEAEGGSGGMDLLQQNTAQSGRLSNNCGNPNNLTVTATGSSTRAQCVAADRSTNIGSVHR
ncbi:hypothetical protein [Streptomyces aurantiogriseus]|uniref:hypothetical protein n=1 Tax=Streptomyces aurantiogriseus TaxID=66870 RepID=UPI001672E83F|nr:hypothetical protein [Streptomyces aurantiogriseus]